MRILCGRTLKALYTIVAIGVASLLSSPATAKDDPSVLKPYSVRFSGDLRKVSGIGNVVRGNTIIITQPWVNRKKFELRETAIYFSKNGKAYSKKWGDIPYKTSGNLICLNSNSFSNCYTPFQDSRQQAYLADRQSGLLGQVTSIEAGDSRKVRAAYAEMIAQRKAQAAAMAAFIGLMFEGAFYGGGGGGSYYSNDDQLAEQLERNNSYQPSYNYAPPPPPISSFYGSCHNPMGC